MEAAIWFIGPQRHQRATVEQLVAAGVQVDLLCVDLERDYELFRSSAPGALLYSNAGAKAALPPEGFHQALPSVSADLLRALGTWEGLVLQMMDRQNVDRLPVWELRSLYHDMVALWSALLDERPPDLVVFHDLPCRGYDFVLYELCVLRSIPLLIFGVIKLDDRVMVQHDPFVVPVPASFAGTPADAERDGPAAFRDGQYLSEVSPLFHSMERVHRTMRRKSQVRAVVARGIWPPWRRHRHGDYVFPPRRPSTIELRVRRAREIGTVRRLYEHYESLATPIDPGRPFVYLPLQFQPERSTLPQASPLVDQVNVCRMVAEALPEGWDLVIKEHPGQLVRPYVIEKGRSERFYDRVAAVPRVVLASTATPSEDLTAAARAVATGSGTPAWEGLRLGIPAIVWGFPWFLHCPGVVRVGSVDDCRKALSRVEAGDVRVDPADVARYAEAFSAECTIAAACNDEMLEHSSLSAAQSAAAYTGAILRRLSA